MKRKALIPGLMLCLSAWQLYAQQTLKGGAPDARLMPGLSGDGNQGSVYSPNLFNGTANINIPIYSYSDNGISLSYNTAGVKVDELSGAVGLHWVLNAGGSITRSVKDVPDEINTYDSIQVPMGSGDIGDYSMGIKGKWAQDFGGHNPSSPYSDEARYMDGESDDFVFSVGSLSFTFNIGKDVFIFTNPHTNIKIDLLINGVAVTKMPIASDNNSLTFRVRDALGNWYYFEKGDVSRKTYPVPGSQGDEIVLRYTSKWVITKIVQNDGSEINYHYDDFSFNNLNNTYTEIYSSFTAKEQSGVPVPEAEILKSNELYFSTRQLASIDYPNSTTATFVYDPNSGSRCDDPTNGGTNPILREIRITSADAGIRYVMDQAYALSNKDFQNIPVDIPLGSCYNVNTSGDDDYRYHRLILKGIHLTDLDGNVSQPYYSFGYKDLRLPPRFSGSQDYYGYYNGKTVTQNGGMLSIPGHVPRYGGSATAYGVDRSDDAAFAIAGILVSMKNASGGVTEFTYEAHKLGNVLGNAGMTLPSATADPWFFGRDANDGVRLQSITTYDPRYPGLYTRQNFSYTGGQRFMPGGYFDYPMYNGGGNTIFNSSFVSPHQFVNGSNHGYNNVTVETRNNSDQLLSKRVTVFQNISTAPGITAYFNTGSRKYFQYPFTDKQYIKEWELGLPLNVTDYDQNGNKVSVTINTYASLTDYTSAVGKVENDKILATTDLSGANTTTVESEHYRPYTGVSLLTRTVTQKYITGATAIRDTVKYEYDDRNNLLTTTTTNSRGETFMLKNIYNYQVSGTDVQYGSAPGTLHDLTDDGLEFKVGIERWKVNSNSPYYDELYDASITKYQYQGGRIRTQKLFTLRSLEPIYYTSYTGITMGGPGMNAFGKILSAYNTAGPVAGFQQVSEVLQFDSKGNPQETKISDQEVYKSMIWDPYTGNKLADISDARLKDVGFSSFERAPFASYTGTENSTDGGIGFNQWGSVEAPDAVSGTRIFKLVPPGSTANNKIISPVLTAGTTYMMTLWSKSGTPVVSGAGLTNIPLTSVDNAGSWTQWITTFTATTNTSVQLTAAQTLYVDEIRLFPKGAQMTNAVYTPFIGATSTTDAQGRITHYLYDVLGRQTAIKDQKGNVISKQDRHIVQ